MTNPVPIVVEPSGEFLGNDGAWSPFLVKVGTPPTPLRLLASTEIPETWVVVSLGCQGAASNCSDARGGIFDYDGSRTWSYKSNDYINSIFKINTEVNLQLDVNATYGFDTVQIGSPGKGNATVDHQVVAGIAEPSFYLGSLGLHNRSVVFQDDQQSQRSFISLLNLNKQIPSMSYGFTAGASYRPANASLILGGYDAARFTPNDVSFTFSPNLLRQKVVWLQSIWYTNSNSDGILLALPKGGAIETLVDSTVPHIWLPPETCKAFERAFGLTYNPIANLYLINDTIHNTLLKQNPSIIFQLSNNANHGPAVNITLPYASFDLEVKAGYNTGVLKNSRYFPLRQANQGVGQYTLGRTFLQESYLIVNYEYLNFSISQVKVSNDQPHIVPIAAATSTGSPSSLPPGIIKSTSVPSTPSGSSGGSKSLATPAIAGIAIAIVAIILAAFGAWFYRRRTQRKRPMKETPELSGEHNHPHSAAELGAFDGNHGNEKTPGLIVTEASDQKIQSDYDKNQILMGQAGHDPSRGISRAELAGAPGSDLLRPELPSPDPSNRHELSSSEAEVIRSELSTPEPIWPVEMPSPEIGASELGGSTVRGGSSEGRPDSPAFSLWSRERTQAPSHRTGAGHGSIDSNASDDNNRNINWAAIPGSIIPASSSHSRMPSSNDSTASNSRPPHTRLDSTSSSISSSSLLPRGVGPSYTNYLTRPPHSRMDSNTSDTPSLPTPSTISRRHSMPYPTSYSFPRPSNRRLDSKDSTETFETRLELSPPISPFLPPPSAASSSSSPRVNNNNNNNNNNSPSNRGAVLVEALPSTWIPGDGNGDGTTPSFIIHHHHHHSSRNSILSALRSPDPFDPAGFGVQEEDEDNDDDGDGVKEEREDEERVVISRREGILSEEPEKITGARQQQENDVHPVKEEEANEATKLMAGEEGKGKPSKK